MAKHGTSVNLLQIEGDLARLLKRLQKRPKTIHVHVPQAASARHGSRHKGTTATASVGHAATSGSTGRRHGRTRQPGNLAPGFEPGAIAMQRSEFADAFNAAHAGLPSPWDSMLGNDARPGPGQYLTADTVALAMVDAAVRGVGRLHHRSGRRFRFGANAGTKRGHGRQPGHRAKSTRAHHVGAHRTTGSAMHALTESPSFEGHSSSPSGGHLGWPAVRVPVQHRTHGKK